MENLKKLLQGKKGKFFIAAIAIVAILGFFAWRRSRSSVNTPVVADYAPTPTTDSTVKSGGSAGSGTPDISRADVVGMFQDYNTVVQDAIKGQKEQNKQLSESVNTALAYQQSGFNQTFSGITSGLGDLTSKVNAGLLQNATEKLQTNTQKTTYTETDRINHSPEVVYVDNTVYSAANPYKGNPSVDPTYGVGALDFSTATQTQKDAVTAKNERLKTDEVFRQSEIKRANEKIAAREKDGIDASEQKAYLASLKKIG